MTIFYHHKKSWRFGKFDIFEMLRWRTIRLIPGFLDRPRCSGPAVLWRCLLAHTIKIFGLINCSGAVVGPLEGVTALRITIWNADYGFNTHGVSGARTRQARLATPSTATSVRLELLLLECKAQYAAEPRRQFL